MVKDIRKAINGRAKLIGGLSATAIVTAIAGMLLDERYSVISKAADRVPVIDAWIEGHKTWTETTLAGVLKDISYAAVVARLAETKISARIEENADHIEIQMAREVESLGAWKLEKNESDREWRAEQRTRTAEMMTILRKLEERSESP